MTRSPAYYIFICHSWNYHDEYDRLVNLLDNADGFHWKNYSVPYYKAKNPSSDRKLREKLWYQMKRTQIVIIIAGMYVTYSDWIQDEIDIACGFEKPILGVYPRGCLKTPRVITDIADDVVGWQTKSIVNAIKRLAL